MITFCSTNKKIKAVTFQEALFKGMPEDNGLFMPSLIPIMDSNFFAKADKISFQDIAFEVARHFLAGEIPPSVLRDIIDDAINFDAPLVKLEENLYVMELFHGPTMAFKDFGARFMARVMSYFAGNLNREIYILVATSGDTGSAVASGFLNIPGIRVIILYPSGKVSSIQEKQLTTHGNNITALEIDGTFDDCQKLVKEAFLDKELTGILSLTSANSINIARLIPQSFYYFYACSRVKDRPVIFSVPSGNFGNLTAGLIAKKMGLEVHKFIASTNINDIVPQYLKTGQFISKPSKKTISNAMDVGNPSNFARILSLYDFDIHKIRKDIEGYSFTDEETCNIMCELYEKSGYITDPHGAVGYLGLKAYEKTHKGNFNRIFLETAHPAKFMDIIEPVINTTIEIPERLKITLKKEKKSIFMANDMNIFKSYLLNH
ncbi:MAG: threonine synthase [Candidatus Eremiobacterota bacterium]